MDQFLSGFGSMFSGSVGGRQEPAAAVSVASNNSSNGMTTSPVRQNTSLPNKPVKVNTL